MAIFRFRYPEAIQIKRKVQVLLKGKPSSWNKKAKYEPFCKSKAEQGFCLKLDDGSKVFNIAWANLAGDVVVYSGYGEWAETGNVPTETADKKMFRTTDANGAPFYILQLIQNFFQN